MKRFNKLLSMALSVIMASTSVMFMTVSANAATVKAPTISTAVAKSSSSVKLSWKKVSKVKGYVIYRKTSNSKYKKIKTVSQKTVNFTDSKLSANKKYTYALKSYKKSGKKTVYSKYSNKKSVTTMPKTVSVSALANRSYELRFMFGQTFTSPEKMSVDAMVQYSFCHLYYKDLKDMPTSGMKYRSATVEEIKNEIKNQFNVTDIDVTASPLYNMGKELFEMWEPLFGTKIYHDSYGVKTSSDTCKIYSTFYLDSSKKQKLNSTVLTVKVSGDKVYIKSLA